MLIFFFILITLTKNNQGKWDITMISFNSLGLAHSKTGKGKGISLGVIVAAIAFLFYKYSNLEAGAKLRKKLNIRA